MAEGRHQHIYPFCRVTFWKGYTAADDKEDWTHCMVSPLGAYTHGEQQFGNSDSDIYRRDALISFLEKVYECGRRAAKEEIRQVLGIRESMS